MNRLKLQNLPSQNAISDFHGRASWRLPYFVMWSNDVEYDWTFTRDFLSGKVEGSRMAERGMYFIDTHELLHQISCIFLLNISILVCFERYLLYFNCQTRRSRENYKTWVCHELAYFHYWPWVPPCYMQWAWKFKYLNASWFIQQYVQSFCSTLHNLLSKYAENVESAIFYYDLLIYLL